MSKQQFHVNSSDRKQAMLEAAISVPTDGSIRVTVERLPKTRTARQNRALHKWFELMADELNGAGYDVQTILGQAVGRSWDKEAVKSLLWKPIQEAVTGKESTADADRTEYTSVYEELTRHLADRFGVSVPWPEEEK